MNKVPDRPVMFRAGGDASMPGTAELVKAAAGDVLLSDVSEFQPEIADAAYLGWSRAIAIRAMYGTRVDNAWYGGQRRDLLHSGGVECLLIYQYLTAGQDAAEQARALVALLGPLRRGELLVCDIEEGEGDQRPRWDAWRAVITAEYGPQAIPWLYAGPDFSRAHNLEPQWLAAYQADQPAGDYLLWQFTATFDVPGVGMGDCSLFRGGMAALVAHGWPAVVAPPAPVKPPVLPPGWADVLPVLRLGADDADLPQWWVHRVQAILVAVYGAAFLVTDGTWGPSTDVAFRRFQGTARLAVDGVCGPRSWEVLYTGT